MFEVCKKKELDMRFQGNEKNVEVKWEGHQNWLKTHFVQFLGDFETCHLWPQKLTSLT